MLKKKPDKKFDKKSDKKPRIAISAGEPAGIGPDICLLAHKQVSSLCQPVYFGDPNLFADRARLLGIDLAACQLDVSPIHLNEATQPSQLNKANATYVLDALRAATDACLAGDCAALATGPINKAVINEAGITFAGHTEWLAAHAGASRVAMMLASPALRVVLATTHLPLSEVPAALTRDRLTDVIEVTLAALQAQFGISQPHLLVCGLNPHAGEGGHLGREEIDLIAPVVQSCAKKGHNITGPVPADTAFTPASLEGIDAVIAMYHDQGLPVLKASGFGKIVNITLGLPIIRTSVDHGTALDLAGTGKADPGSFIAAVKAATELC